MTSLTKMVIQEDISLQDSSALLWKLKKERPDIRQIYGHFLPPVHRKLVKGLVAKDFNFPPAAHDSTILYGLEELYNIGDRIGPDTLVSLNDSVKIRAEKSGAIAYTSYFNGFFMNESAHQILKCCACGSKVEQIVNRTGVDLETILKFLARALTLGIVHVSLS